MKVRFQYLALIILLLLSHNSVFGCTTFVLNKHQQIIYGRNFDFEYGSGFIVNNQRNINKYAFVARETNVAKWTSKYGSITFNQFGKEFPYGGMNEKGLVIAQLYLSQTKYPEIDKRPAISVLQWIQYQLDVSSSVAEVIESDKIIRITNEVPIGVHFLVCDSQGNSATIEFINGELVYRTGEQLPIPLLTNNTYDESIAYLKQFNVMGGNRSIPWNNIADCEKINDKKLNVNKGFATAAKSMHTAHDSLTLVEQAFDVLKTVSINEKTKWSVVFDISNRLIYFKNKSRKDTILLDFKDFSFEPDAPIKVLDIQSANASNVSAQLKDYSLDLNREYVFNIFNPLMQSGFFPVKLPNEAIEFHASYPETLKRKN